VCERIIRMQIRIPVKVRDFLAEEAKENSRSMNGQLVEILKERMRDAEKRREQQADHRDQ